MAVRTCRLVVLLVACLAVAAFSFAQVPIEILHDFIPSEPGAARSLVVASDGNLYGAGGGIYGGGLYDSPVVLRLTPGGALTVIRNIAGARALSEWQGVLYGLSDDGAFRMGLDGTGFQLLNVPSTTVQDSAQLARASDGSLYGLAVNGPSGHGFVYRLDPQNAYSVVHDFVASEGNAGYIGHLVPGQDGNLYGTTTTSVFRVTPAGQFAIVRALDCSTDPVCFIFNLVQHPGGDLYGVSFPGGLVRVTTAGVATVVGPASLHASKLAAGTDGNLYATDDASTVYRVTPAGVVTVVKTLSAAEGTHAWDLTAAPDGSIYGSTADGGAFNKGSVFRVGAGGSFAVLHTFISGPEGMNPNALVQGDDGALYGTARTGGSTDRGTLFRVATDGTFTVVHQFGAALDGAYPLGVTQGLDGFYVTTELSLTSVNQVLDGALMRFTGSGAGTLLFRQPRPLNAVLAASDGALYGLGLGANSSDVLYHSSTSGAATTAYAFPDSFALSFTMAVPRPLLEGPDHALYGTTTGYFTVSNPFKVPGTVFRLSPDRTTFTTLHVFDPAFSYPGAIVLATDGNLYGTSSTHELYRISAPGSATPVYTTLASPPLGATLIQAADGHLYANWFGNDGGQIYRISTAGVVAPVFAFPGGTFITSLTAGRDGLVYGTTSTSGNAAAIFRFPTPEVMTLDAPGNNTTAAQPFYAGGWAIDRAAASDPGVDAVHLWAFPATGGAAVFLGAAEYFRPRADVASAYGAQFANSGYRLAVNGLPPGTYTFVAYAHSRLTGAFSQSRASVVTVTNAVSPPAMNIDIPGPGATVTGSFQVAGWAIDRAALDDAGVDAVHVYAFGAGGSATFLGVAAHGQPRPDVGTAYGAQFTNAGFSLNTAASLTPGIYTLVVYARSTVSGAFFSQSRSITVRAPGDPVMTIDTPSSGASLSQPFNLAGWAIDRDAAAGPGVDAVHVWAYPLSGGSPIFVGTGQLNFARGDVGAAYGSQFTNSGYNVTVSGLPAGQYQIVVYAHSTVTGTFNQSRVITVIVQP